MTEVALDSRVCGSIEGT